MKSANTAGTAALPEKVNTTMENFAGLSFVITRGAGAGTMLKPHLHEDGKYVASMTRFEKDYIRVDSVRELLILAEHGFSIRMSDAARAPSLISPGSLRVIPRQERDSSDVGVGRPDTSRGE